MDKLVKTWPRNHTLGECAESTQNTPHRISSNSHAVPHSREGSSKSVWNSIANLS